MKKVNNIFHHNKGVVTELEYIGENPKDISYSIWIEKKSHNIVKVLNSDLSTRFMYSDCEYDMMVRKNEWLKIQQKELEMWFDNNSK